MWLAAALAYYKLHTHDKTANSQNAGVKLQYKGLVSLVQSQQDGS